MQREHIHHVKPQTTQHHNWRQASKQASLCMAILQTVAAVHVQCNRCRLALFCSTYTPPRLCLSYVLACFTERRQERGLSSRSALGLALFDNSQTKSFPFCSRNAICRGVLLGSSPTKNHEKCSISKNIPSVLVLLLASIYY